MSSTEIPLAKQRRFGYDRESTVGRKHHGEQQALLEAISDGPEREELLKQLNREKAAEEAALRQQENARAQAEYEKRARAVVETVLAYYRRGEAIRYDSVDLINAGSR